MLSFEMARDSGKCKMTLGGDIGDNLLEALAFNKIFINQVLAQNEEMAEDYIGELIRICEEFLDGERLDIVENSAVSIDFPEEYQNILRLIAKKNGENKE